MPRRCASSSAISPAASPAPDCQQRRHGSMSDSRFRRCRPRGAARPRRRVSEAKPGLALLRERAAALPEAVSEAYAGPDPMPGLNEDAASSIVATGVGSSAAHARFLVHLLANEIGVPARFASPGSFVAAPGARARDELLVVFSQGLSPNARFALAHPEAWRRVVLVTATAPEGGTRPDAAEKHGLLERFTAAGGCIVPMPGADEYGTLLRLTGPLVGYLTALRLAKALAPARAALPGIFSIPSSRVRAAVAKAPGRVEAILRATPLPSPDEALAFVALGRLGGAGREPALQDPGLATPCAASLGPPPAGPRTLAGAARPQRLPRRTDTFRCRLRGGSAAESRGAPRARPPSPAAPRSDPSGPTLHRRARGPRREPRDARPRGRRPGPCALGGLRRRERPLPDCSRSRGPSGGAQTPASHLARGGSFHRPRLQHRHRARWVRSNSTARTFPSTPTRASQTPGGAPRAAMPEALRLPALWAGCSREHMAFPGTLDLRPATLEAVLVDLVDSLVRHGFQRIVLFSAHGGNDAVLRAAEAPPACDPPLPHASRSSRDSTASAPCRRRRVRRPAGRRRQRPSRGRVRDLDPARPRAAAGPRARLEAGAGDAAGTRSALLPEPARQRAERRRRRPARGIGGPRRALPRGLDRLAAPGCAPRRTTRRRRVP